jgi:hypothetical protein
MFWEWLQENHPIISEVVWFGILILAIVALVKS